METLNKNGEKKVANKPFLHLILNKNNKHTHT